MKSKSDAPLAKIDTTRARKKLREPTWRNGRDVVAFDTETADGHPFMLSVSDGETEETYVVDEGGDPLSAETLWRHVTSQRWKGKICVWFNIGFDAEVLLSAGLDADDAETVQATGYVEAERDGAPDLEVTYLKNKLLRVSDEYGNTVTHYDIGAIVRGSLDSAAGEWTSRGKLGDVDTSRFGNREYVDAHLDEIRRYAKRDADVTREVAENVIEKAESIGIPAGRPVSTGYLAAEFLRERLDEKPGWGLNRAQSLAWDAYAGGRFEVFERGDVGRVAGPDINSAYPAIMAELPDPSTLAWEVRDDADKSGLREADYGFVKATVTTDADAKIQPFAVKTDGVVKYPALDGVETTTLLDTFVFALDAGLVEDFTIESVALGYETPATTYPFDFFEDLYTKRKTWENVDNRPKTALMLKIVLNSMYGKTAQTTIKRDTVDSAGTEDELAPGPAQRIRVANGRPILETQEAGSLFNPFIASYITGKTRLQLHETVHNLGLTDDVVMFATDCVMIREDAFDASDFSDVLEDETPPEDGGESYAERLGKWDFDYRGRAFVVGSGVYEVETDEDYLKMATRGFREAKVDSLREAAERAASAGRDTIPIESTRPITLGEAIHSGGDYSLADVGRFRSDSRTNRGLSADFDKKRAWPDETTYADLLDGRQTGGPLILRDAE